MERIESILIIIDIILKCVGGDRYLLSFPYMLVCKKWYQIFQSDEFWRSLCLARWTSLSLLEDDFQISTFEDNANSDNKSSKNQNPDDDDKEPLGSYSHTTFKYRRIKVKCWKDLFKSRFNRTLHLRFLNTRFIPKYLEYVKNIEESLVHPIGMVKKMESLDETSLDDFRKDNDIESLFLLESVVYYSIYVRIVDTKHYYASYLTISGSLMSYTGKKIEFLLDFSSDEGSDISIGSIRKSDFRAALPDHFWESVQQHIQSKSMSIDDLKYLFEKILLPRDDMDIGIKIFHAPNKYIKFQV
ncbi:hypothetical protein DFA_04332 [Cavenderia fasciculata]|uniref:F-box domain-containing protein n=1 Tax=Cavenderia fasciculata TaxID=261658 RepID=F4PPA1_CACFS|nr:uncharacterized protein DFA_04332 [Cavenderia fasciculata]EGG22214.1 hypothetical protein DFA_04332 [Cavenderia fasciculata]|eukprot:XP_004360065.1 hypothetical protein DFA_04332 [Cavenderia fasciculata]